MTEKGDSALPREGILTMAVIACLVSPWLNPWAAGPSPAVMPWLMTLFFAAWLLIVIPVSALSLASVGGVALLALLASSLTTSSQVLPVLGVMGIFCICAGTGVRAARDDSVTRCVVGAWLAAGLLSSVIGLVQYFGVSDNFGSWVNPARAGEAFANLRQRNQFATLTNIALVALFWFAMIAGTSVMRSLVGRRQWLLMVAAGLLAAGNAASSSRTGLLQLALLCALCWLWGGRRQAAAQRVLLTAVLAYVLAMLLLPWLAGFDLWGSGITARLRAGDPICASRLTLWSNVLHLIAQKPWFGWGWGELGYVHYMTLYPGARFCDILDNAHNLPLHLAVELGIPVALLVCGIFCSLVLRARPWRETDPTRQMAWSVLALILLHSMLEYPLWYGPFQMAFGLCVGMLWVAPARSDIAVQQAEKFKSNRPSTLYFRMVAAIIIIAFVVYAALDYYRVSQIYQAPDARDPAYRDDTLRKIRGTWLFGNQLRFAELSITPLTPANAAQIYALSSELLHYSPEPRVIEKGIESAVLLGRDDEALAHLARYRAAFPADHARWAQANVQVPERLQRLQ